MPKGVYTLLFRNSPCRARIGAIGMREFSVGWHIYVGSARGSGGFARVRRHQRLALLKDRPPRWHIDYLLLDPHFDLSATISAATDRDCECDLARAIGGTYIPGFGCSDCTCPSHLFFRKGDPTPELLGAFARLDLDARIERIKNEGCMQ